MIHWLQIGGIKTSKESEDKQWRNLNKYLEDYPGSEVTVFLKNTGDVFARIVKLKCNQNYRDLDLDCNSCFDGSIKRLAYKPKDIFISKKQFDCFISRLEGLS